MGSSVSKEDQLEKDYTERMLKMDDNQIEGMCRAGNIYIDKVCNSTHFWIQKIKQIAPNYPTMQLTMMTGVQCKNFYYTLKSNVLYNSGMTDVEPTTRIHNYKPNY